MPKRPRILLGVTGSVAAVKAPEIALRLHEIAQVKILLTRGGVNFWECANEYNSVAWNELQDALNNGSIELHFSEDEWRGWQRLGDPVMHIDLRDWANVMLIAPLSAHSLAKIANGLCDDVLSSVVRAWDFGYNSAKPIILAPAMNTAMWVHPITKQQLSIVGSFYNESGNDDNTQEESKKYFTVVPPQVKMLACGEVGDGALASVDDIIDAVKYVLDNL